MTTTPATTTQLRQAGQAAWDIATSFAPWLLTWLLGAFAYANLFPTLPAAEVRTALSAALLTALVGGLASLAGWLPILVADKTACADCRAACDQAEHWDRDR